jgi:hypothetical protein
MLVYLLRAAVLAGIGATCPTQHVAVPALAVLTAVQRLAPIGWPGAHYGRGRPEGGLWHTRNKRMRTHRAGVTHQF